MRWPPLCSQIALTTEGVVVKRAQHATLQEKAVFFALVCFLNVWNGGCHFKGAINRLPLDVCMFWLHSSLIYFYKISKSLILSRFIWKCQILKIKFYLIKPRPNSFDFSLYIARQMSSIVECCRERVAKSSRLFTRLGTQHSIDVLFE